MEFQGTKKTHFTFQEMLELLPEGRTFLASALEPLIEKSIILFTPPGRDDKKRVTPALYSLNENVFKSELQPPPESENLNQETTYLHYYTTTTDQEEEDRKKETSVSPDFEEFGLDQDLEGMAQKYELSPEFLKQLLKSRMEHFGESTPNISLLIRHCEYGLQRLKANQIHSSYSGYIRSNFLNPDFNWPCSDCPILHAVVSSPPSGEKPVKQIDQEFHDLLKNRIDLPSYNTWLRQSTIANFDCATATIEVPTKTHQFWLEQYYTPVFQNTLQIITGKKIPEINVIVKEEGE